VPRYVILEHTGTLTYKSGIHWDLMLEAGDALRAWELAAIPTPGAVVLARSLPSHRLEYLDYEGPISNNRGSVRRWDCGTYQAIRESASEIEFQLMGKQLRGSLLLKQESPGSAGPWRVTLKPS
jgi:hypothetical protein